MRARLMGLGLCVLLSSCGKNRKPETDEQVNVARPARSASSQAPPVAKPTAPVARVLPQEAPVASKPSCPEGMNLIPGGTFWVGTERATYEHEENPRFQTKLPRFCAGVMEVSAAEYERCQEAGRCTPSSLKNHTCNTSAKGRGEHPMNCIDNAQATAVCEFLGGRLPTEIEWEYLARGGSEMRTYPWGEAPVDGNTCWKSNKSCERGKFTEGAFGLHDVVGNVWEWTESWFAPYPWPAASGRHKVYRGGSWSRRFDKWMRASLRNRLDPSGAGSHLGVRCVADLPKETCPYGRDASSGRCLPGVEQVQCLDGTVWNGVRCAEPGDERRCARGEEVPGHGCVRERVRGPVDRELDTSAVVRARSPEFDADCETNAPSKPKAYRLTGGGHLARNAQGKTWGCKNRDVGVGWNSACCP